MNRPSATALVSQSSLIFFSLERGGWVGGGLAKIPQQILYQIIIAYTMSNTAAEIIRSGRVAALELGRAWGRSEIC